MDKFSFRSQAAILLLGGTIAFFTVALALPEFKKDQLRYNRVRTAYAEKENGIIAMLRKHSLNINSLEIYLRIFKGEEIMELWCKDAIQEKFKLVKTYPICATSGDPGPKRQQGDLQIPEGFYHIDRFNPASNFYLSLGINYPNTSDRILGKQGRLGGDIFIHGACATIGCVPITDELIKEVYVLSVEAKENGQNKIPVTIFPSRLTKTNYDQLRTSYETDNDKINLWTDLKVSYDLFHKTEQLPMVSFLNNGRHSIK